MNTKVMPYCQPDQIILDTWREQSMTKLKDKIKDNLQIRLTKTLQVINYEMAMLAKEIQGISCMMYFYYTFIPSMYPMCITYICVYI